MQDVGRTLHVAGGLAERAFHLTALDDLNSYPWPGNVRELQNCIERAVILCDADTIQPRHLSLPFRQPAVAASATSPWEAINLSGTMAEVLRRISMEVERRKLEIALSEAAGNVQRVADVLQISYKTVQQKLKEYGLAEG